jgi:phenylalanyl-tRNA synthetase alpha chain
MMDQEIKNIKLRATKDIAAAVGDGELFSAEKKYLGKKGELTAILKKLKDLSGEERKTAGNLANAAKKEIISSLESRRAELRRSSVDLEKERIDVTIPGKKVPVGHLNPITIVQNEIEDIFTSLGFEITDGPEVETEFYNFDALNIPPNHPARDAWDTFWLKPTNNQQPTTNNQSGKLSVVGDKLLLRTHTSPVQIRYMQKNKPPFRIIAPGKCFRNEATDSTHEHTFYQFEALMVGDDINVGNFKYVGEQFFSRFFHKDVKIRLRPSFFPFTEPSFEFDISCTVCGGKGCRSCKNTGWLEVGGAGMVNQEVFAASGYPRNKYQGFAWGFGLERLAMMKYKIDDIRLFHSGDLRFTRQF